MQTIELQNRIVREFGISRDEAEKMVESMVARRSVKIAVARAIKGDATAQDPQDLNDPHTWGIEQQKRRAALKVLDEGVRALVNMRKLLDKIIKVELKFIAAKKNTINDKSDEWWNFCQSGWARGGRELFAQFVRDILHSIDETKLGDSIRNRLGFVRTVPLPDIQVQPQEPEDPLEDELGAAGQDQQKKRSLF